ncbi:uncharacterized protein TRAVEDRAFT_66303 [Trametes versicolor FP-101664 SS1]|uniref:uncharacterized protein n=1 Tax=Trametes versicolor (strain FP-101664) TaxID=717944 RepID=UPI00046243A3|nr:uncharacterized protein TRAVEDRAFT_66303 [Trametes versicolor FP-101664 SS1]EIW54712.1 hypothetical protein TRAVEDRAFT_66303 [Trametes versicolor FP-101664 SS1]
MPAYRTRDASSRNLEVSTDAPPPPPTVSIISPTPRAFTFPITDTRFPSSPSSSPFEPTLKSIPSTPPPFRPFSPTSSIGSDSSISVLDSVYSVPESALSVPESFLSSPSTTSSLASSHRRRRSTASDIGERRPKKGDEDYIKRPENAFILFRRKCCEDRQAAREEEESTSGPVKKQRQADLSKTISQQWKSLPAEERQYWEDLAKEKKKEHEAMYPNYVYRPQRNKDKKKKGKSASASRRGDEQDDDAESFSFLLPVSSSPSRNVNNREYASSGHGHGHGRRAVSAPTPPPQFQSIQLPSVWMPSCPTSPTLIPRISGRSPAPVANIPPPTESAPLTTFDYAPNDHLFMSGCDSLSMYDENGQPMNGPYHNMYQMSANGGVPPLLHSLTIPRDSSAMTNMMSPAESIASTLVGSESYTPSSYASSIMSSPSTHGAPFTPDDALRMMSLSMPPPKDVPENVDGDGDDGEMPMPYGFWPTSDALWANMESLMNEDFNLCSIPPVELGLAQFEALTQSQQSNGTSSSSSTIRPEDEQRERDEYECEEYPNDEYVHEEYPNDEYHLKRDEYVVQHMPEEHDFHVHDATTPGLDTYSGVFAHDSSMNW